MPEAGLPSTGLQLAHFASNPAGVSCWRSTETTWRDRMRRSTFAALMAIAAIALVSNATHAQIVPSRASCLHGNPERQVDRSRREQAITLMKAINAAEGRALQQTRN